MLDLPRRGDAPLQLQLDPEWLCVLRATNHLLNLRRTFTVLPDTSHNRSVSADASRNRSVSSQRLTQQIVSA